MRKLFTGIALVFALLVGVAPGLAQAGQATPPPVVYPLELPVLSGSDIGFRVEGRNGGKVSGHFVVRVNGQWVEAQPSARIMPIR